MGRGAWRAAVPGVARVGHDLALSFLGFHGSSGGKESMGSAGDPSSIPELGMDRRERMSHSSLLGLPLRLNWERIHLQCGRPGFDPWVGKIPLRSDRLPTPAFWPGESHALCSPRGCKEPDTTERLSLTPLLSCRSLGRSCSWRAVSCVLTRKKHSLPLG